MFKRIIFKYGTLSQLEEMNKLKSEITELKKKLRTYN